MTPVFLLHLWRLPEVILNSSLSLTILPTIQWITKSYCFYTLPNSVLPSPCPRPLSYNIALLGNDHRLILEPSPVSSCSQSATGVDFLKHILPATSRFVIYDTVSNSSVYTRLWTLPDWNSLRAGTDFIHYDLGLDRVGSKGSVFWDTPQWGSFSTVFPSAQI